MNEIIVYRSPAEAAVWGALSNGEFFPVMAGIIVFLVAFLLSRKLIYWFVRKPIPFSRQKNIDYLALCIGALAGIIILIMLL